MKDLALRKYPIGSYILDGMHITVEQVVAHLKGGWLVGKGEYTDPEVNPWLAIACKRIAPEEPTNVLKNAREEKYREHDQERLVAGELPEGYTIHVVNSSGPHFTYPVDTVKVFSHGPLTVFTWGRDGYLIWETDYGEPEVGVGGGEVIHHAHGIQVCGNPELASAPPDVWNLDAKHLHTVCWWLERYWEESQEEDTDGSL